MWTGIRQTRSSWVRYAGLWALLWSVLACSREQEKKNQPVTPPTPARKEVIVVLGSSTAAGYGASDSKNAWVNRYREYLQGHTVQPCTVVNLAVAGYTTYHVLPTDAAPVKDRPKPDAQHNITQALTNKPTILIINLPTNDIVAGYESEEVMQNYARIVNAAAPVPVRITTPQPRNTDTARRKKLIELKKRLEQTYGPKAVDFWTGLANQDSSIKPEYNADGTHVNDKGHEVLFNKVLQAKLVSVKPD